MRKADIAILAGDGIGPEVMEASWQVLEQATKKYQEIELTPHEALVGGAAYEKYGEHFPPATQEVCRKSAAILFGSVGGPVHLQHEPRWAGCEAKSILAVRKAFSFATNFRPVKLYPALAAFCPLKAERIAGGVDILFVRELLGDIYFGEKTSSGVAPLRQATDLATYTERQIQVVTRQAFEAARLRKKRVTSVDKANVLSISKLWRGIVSEVAAEFPDVTLTHLLVDNAAMQLITQPTSFDVLLTSNMFGDILSDEGAVLAGSLGLLPSASFNDEGFALYEPSGGSAPDIAGQGIANPIAQILSAALMLRYSFAAHQTAIAMEQAIERVLQAGVRSRDIALSGEKAVSTKEFSEQIIKNL